jgi:hypothetical protein
MSKSKIASQLLFVTWMLVISFLALLIAFTIGASMFRHTTLGGNKLPQDINAVVQKLGLLPSLVKIAVLELHEEITDKPLSLLIPKNNITQANWVHKFPAPEDEGYLLLSSITAQEGQSIVQLIRIADGKVIAKWIPDWLDIYNKITDHVLVPKGSVRRFRAINPLLMSDGSLIFNTNSSLVRLPLCSSKPSWILNYPYHHSIELSPEGNSVWVPSVTDNFAISNPLIEDKLRDDSLSEVSLNGQVIQNLSFSKILSDNNMIAHMIGTSGFTVQLDPLHINQITPALSDSPYWKKNDLLISARHTSSIYLYRPSTGKIVWYQQGPWINQHSSHFVNQHAIAVFSNHVYGSGKKSKNIFEENHNQIFQFDFKTNLTQTLQSESLNSIRPTTFTEGRVKVLEDKSMFIEETNNARLFKLNSKGQLVWSYINTYDANNLGVVSWSRYLTNKELRATVNIEMMKCTNN